MDLDYKKERPKNYKLTKEEENYITHDVKIVAMALNIMFKQDLTKMTQGSNALADFKKDFKKSKLERLFPKVEKQVDKEIRKSYKGGFTYLSPDYKEKDVENVVNLDVNSLYPYIMYTKSMPFRRTKGISWKI